MRVSIVGSLLLLPRVVLAQGIAADPPPNIWLLLLVVCVAGAIGGVINALLTDNGFMLPRPEDTNSGRIFRPGYLGNVLVGAVAAGISWGLYGPLATVVIMGASVPGSPAPALTMSALAGGVLIGVGGAKWLTNEVDKRLIRAAAVEAASKQANVSKSAAIALASPMKALEIARTL